MILIISYPKYTIFFALRLYSNRTVKHYLATGERPYRYRRGVDLERNTEKKSNTKSKHGRKTKLKDSNLILRNNVKFSQANQFN